MPSRRDRIAVVVGEGRTRRWPRFLGIGLAVFLLLFFVGGGWYFSGLIRNDALLVEEHVLDYGFTVTGVSSGSITFALPANPPADPTSRHRFCQQRLPALAWLNSGLAPCDDLGT